MDKGLSVGYHSQLSFRMAHVFRSLVGKIYTHTPSVFQMYMNSEKHGKVQTVALLDVIPIK